MNRCWPGNENERRLRSPERTGAVSEIGLGRTARRSSIRVGARIAAPRCRRIPLRRTLCTSVGYERDPRGPSDSHDPARHAAQRYVARWIADRERSAGVDVSNRAFTCRRSRRRPCRATLESGIRRASEVARREQAEPHLREGRSRLDPLVQRFGSQEAVLEQTYRGLEAAVPASGRFTVTRLIGGQSVVIDGAVVEHSALPDRRRESGAGGSARPAAPPG